MAKMRTKKEIQAKLESLKEQARLLKIAGKDGFDFPDLYHRNKNQQKVHAVLIVGLQWVLGEEFNSEKLYSNE